MTLSTKIKVFYGFYICSQWAFIHALLSHVPFALAGLSCTECTSALNEYNVLYRYRQRAPLSVYGYAVKSIIDPQACLRMHNHYCWAVTPGYEDRGYIEVVNETIAVNQHYKRCHLNQTECSNALKAASVDLTMNRYRDKLVANVVRRVSEIFAGQSPAEFLYYLHRYS